MKVREVMTGQPLTAQGSDSIMRVAKIMRACDVGAVPILSNDKLVGILTDRDITVRGTATGLNIEHHQAQEIMSSDLLVISPDAELEEAADIMADAKIRRLPIVLDSKLIGLISLGDLAVASKGHEQLCGVVLENVSEPIGPKCSM